MQVRAGAARTRDGADKPVSNTRAMCLPQASIEPVVAVIVGIFYIQALLVLGILLKSLRLIIKIYMA